MVSEKNTLKIFDRDISFTSKEMSILRNKGYDKDGTSIEIILWDNDIESFPSHYTDEYIKKIVFDAVKNYEHIVNETLEVAKDAGVL